MVLRIWLDLCMTVAVMAILFGFMMVTVYGCTVWFHAHSELSGYIIIHVYIVSTEPDYLHESV